MQTIEAWPLPSLQSRYYPEDYWRCRSYYSRSSCAQGGLHLGQDMWADTGTLVITPCIVWVRRVSLWAEHPNDPYGNWVILQSEKTGKGIWMAHLKTISVRKGQKLSTGQLVGTVGSTGTNSTGPHLHIELHNPFDQFHKTERIWPELEAARLGVPPSVVRRRPMSVKCEGYQNNADRIDLFWEGDSKDCMHAYSLNKGQSWKTENLGGDLLQVTHCAYKAASMWVSGIGTNQRPYTLMFNGTTWAKDWSGGQ